MTEARLAGLCKRSLYKYSSNAQLEFPHPVGGRSMSVLGEREVSEDTEASECAKRRQDVFGTTHFPFRMAQQHSEPK